MTHPPPIKLIPILPLQCAHITNDHCNTNNNHQTKPRIQIQNRPQNPKIYNTKNAETLFNTLPRKNEIYLGNRTVQ